MSDMPKPLASQPKLPVLRDPVNAAIHRELLELRTFCNQLLKVVEDQEARITQLENP